MTTSVPVPGQLADFACLPLGAGNPSLIYKEMPSSKLASVKLSLQLGGCTEPRESQDITGNQQQFFPSQCHFIALADTSHHSAGRLRDLLRVSSVNRWTPPPSKQHFIFFFVSPRIMPISDVICNFRFKITCQFCLDLHRKPDCHFKSYIAMMLK